MSPLVVLVLLGLGALMFLGADKKKPLKPGDPGFFEYEACYDEGIPLEMKIELDHLIKTAVDPNDLELAAQAADAQGWPLLAACLRERARQLRNL